MIGASKFLFKNFSSTPTSGTKGYFAGGATGSGSSSAVAEKITYSSDTTAAQTTANLSTARRAVSGLKGDSTKGYFMGGGQGTTYYAICDKITVSTDTRTLTTTGNLSLARKYARAISEGSTKGYCSGGETGSTVTRVATGDKTTFSSDTTAAQTSANMITATSIHGSISEGSTKGYWCGGQTGAGAAVFVNSGQKIVFSTDTNASQTSANLSSVRDFHAGVSGEGTKGYFCGGLTSGTGFIATTDKTTYSTDSTAAATTANLSTIRYGCAGQSEGYTKGYVGGGASSTTMKTTTDMITYSTDTTSTPGSAVLSLARYDLGALSANSV